MSGDKLPLDDTSGLTGFWIHDHGTDLRPSCRFEVRFAFEGEILFEDIETARLAAGEYAKILRECDPEFEQRERAMELVKTIAACGASSPTCSPGTRSTMMLSAEMAASGILALTEPSTPTEGGA